MDEILHEGNFLLYDGPRCHVILRSSGIAYRKLNFYKSNGGDYEQISVNDIVGCHCMRDKPRKSSQRNSNSFSREESDSTQIGQNEQTKVYICFYCYPLKRKRLGKKVTRTRIELIFQIDEFEKAADNFAAAEKWRDCTGRLIRNMPQDGIFPDRKLLVLVNPRSGPGKALQIFKQRVIPILAEAAISYHLIVTDKSNHAREFITKCPTLNEWSGIVIVSGDGLLFEVFNGLMERDDWKEAIQTPVGVVPGGSGNGLARAIGHALSEPYIENMVLSSTLNLLTGHTLPMDLVRIETNSCCLYSFLSIGWGLLADIDIESEKLRALGEQRFALWSLARIIGLRSYRGRVSYLPSTVESTSCSFSQANVTSDTCDSSVRVLSHRRSASLPRDVRRSSATSPSFSMPSLSSPVPDSWVSSEDDFLLVYVVYQTHIGSDLYFAPLARLDDGIMWLLMVRKGVSRRQILSFMLSLESGEHIRCPFVDMIPVRAVRIEPYTENGYMTVDGESIDHGPLQAQVLPSIARILVR